MTITIIFNFYCSLNMTVRRVASAIMIAVCTLGCESKNANPGFVKGNQHQEAAATEADALVSQEVGFESTRATPKAPQLQSIDVGMLSYNPQDEVTTERSETESRTQALSANPKIFGLGVLNRSGNADGKTWDTAQLQFYLLDLKPSTVDSITIVPYKTGVPAMTIKVGKLKREHICETNYWDLKPVKISDEIYSNINPLKERAFTFAVIQPPVSYFKHTDSVGNLASATLDSMFYPGTLEFAIDVSGDGVADVAKTRYCCDDASVHPDSLTGDRAKGGCYRCSSAFHRNDEGAWERTYSTGPC